MSAGVVLVFGFDSKVTSDLHLDGVILSSRQQEKGEVENHL